MIRVKTTRRVDGMSKLAERFGVTRSHLWKVREGRTQSARLVAELESIGIKCKKYKGGK
jgi:DNA-binding phage protein